MMNSAKKKVAQTFAALLVTAAISGCQTGKTPHPFTTMFDRQGPEYGVAQAVHQADIPATMGEHQVQTAASESAEVY